MAKTITKSKPVLTGTVTLGSLFCQKIFKRSFRPVKEALFRIGVILQAIAEAEQMAKGNKVLDDILSECEKELDITIAQLKQIIETNGIGDFCSYTDTQVLTVEFDTPKLRRYLRLIENTDTLLLLVDTLWLNEQMEDFQKKRASLYWQQRLVKLSNRIIHLGRSLNAEARRHGKEEEVKKVLKDAGRSDEELKDIQEIEEDTELEEAEVD